MVLQAPMWGEDIEKCAAQALSLCESRRALVLGYPEDVQAHPYSAEAPPLIPRVLVTQNLR